MSDTTELELQPEPAPKPRSNGRIAAALVAVVAVIAGGIFAISALGGDENKPEDPVRAMFAAAEKSDVIGILEQLAPGERDAVRGPLADLVHELNRLEVFKDADPKHVSGVDVEVKDLELEAKEVSDDLADVRITGGNGKISYDLAKLPLGDFVLDLIGHPLSGSDSTSDSLKGTNDDVVNTVKRGGRWYVSIGYTAAESARRDQNVSLENLGDGVAPAGAASAEDAVRQMAQAGAGLDVRKLIGLLPPDEFGALQDYAGLFLPEAEQGVDAARDHVSAHISKLDLDSKTDGDEAVVKVKAVELDASYDDSKLAYRDGCLTITPSGSAEKKVCNGDDPLKSFDLFSGGMFDMDTSDLTPPDIFHGKAPDVGIVVRKVDGKWFVDPTRTVLDAMVSTLRVLDRKDLDAVVDYVKDLQAKLTESLSGGVSYSSGAGYSTQQDASTEPAPDY